MRDFDPERWFGSKEVRQLDRFAQFSIAAADLAVTDAGAIEADPAKSGVIFATGVGGFDTLAEQVGVYNERGARRVSPRLVPMMMANAGAAGISMRLGWHGPSRSHRDRAAPPAPMPSPRPGASSPRAAVTSSSAAGPRPACTRWRWRPSPT